MRGRLLAGLLLGLLAGSAAARGPVEVRLVLQTLVPVSAQGEPGEPVFADELPPEVLAQVRTAIQALRFEPAQRDGVPVPSELSVDLPLTARPVEGAPPEVVLGTPRPSRLSGVVPPRYPADALRSGLGAAVMLRVVLGPEPGDGPLSSEVVAFEAIDRGARAHRAKFEEAALRTLANCCKLRESIDGVALHGEYFVPITFRVNWKAGAFDPEAFNQRHGGPEPLPPGMARARLLPPDAEAADGATGESGDADTAAGAAPAPATGA